MWKKYYKSVIPKGHEVHHIDGNPENNEPTNLICLPLSEHIKIHEENGDVVVRLMKGKIIQKDE